MASKEPTPELVRSAGSNKGEPINERVLADLPKEELVDEVIQQASEKAVRMLQVKHLTDMVNTVEARSAAQKAQYHKQIEALEKDVQRLQAQQRDRESLSPGQQTISTTGSIDGKRSPKHPCDGIAPSHKQPAKPRA